MDAVPIKIPSKSVQYSFIITGVDSPLSFKLFPKKRSRNKKLISQYSLCRFWSKKEDRDQAIEIYLSRHSTINDVPCFSIPFRVEQGNFLNLLVQ